MNKLLHNIQIILAVFILLEISAFAANGQAPVANFTGTPLSGCSPVIINFQDLSTGNPTSWNWNFGNGNTSVLQNPTASYFTPGTYTVSLTVTNADGTNTLTRTQYISVYQPPTIDFSATPLSGCFPLRVQFTDLSSAGIGNTNVSWLWDFGNGTTSTLQNPLATFTTAGGFTITLRVTNDKGCTKTVSRPNFITSTNGVTAGFTNSQATVCNAPASISFTNTSTGPPTLSYFWDFGDGTTSTSFNPVHTYLIAGTYTAILVTTSSAGCIDTFQSNPIIIGGLNTDFIYPSPVCINETATFVNNSIPVPTSSSWTFGDGGTANTINTSHSYASTGTYTIRLYNTYANCNDSVSHTITVNPKPVSNFFAPITSKCEPPLTVNFQDISTGSPVSWLWDFGDGNTSNIQNPSHTYTSYGNFTITLITANGFGCTDTIIIPDYIIIRRAIINVPLFPVRGCIPYIISPNPIINSVDAVTSYNWDFGDGGTSTVANPNHTYTIQGTYTVTLTITTSTGCTDTMVFPNAVTVGSKPIADFSAMPIPVCGTQPVYFTDLSFPGVNEWLWDFGDGGTSILQNPSHSYSDTGYFSIRFIATNNGCPDTLTRTNYVRILPPIARFNPTPSCSNRLQFSFTDQSIAPLTWEWDFGDGSPLSTVQNPVHLFPSYGNFTVRLIVTNGGCADTIVQTIRTVNEGPDFIANNVIACKAANISFNTTNVNIANIVSYNWDFGDGNNITTTSLNTSNTYTTSGNFTVVLTTTDFNGCINVVTKTNYIRINGAIANFSATNASGCSGLTTTFNDLSTTDGINTITNWQWNFGDGTIQNFNNPPFQHTYSTVGIFGVQLIVTDASGCVDSISIGNIITTTDPMPDFNTADSLTCPGGIVRFTNLTIPAGLANLWDFGDGNTSTLASPSHSYTTPGIYTIKLSVQDINGCADSLIRTSYIRVDVPIPDFTVNDSASSCTPFEVQFTNTSTYYTNVLWDFGLGEGTSNLFNPVHYYNLPGVYPVKLLIKSKGECYDSITKIITVYDTAGSSFNYTPITGCSPFPASFNVVVTGPVDSYFWDFGDGNTAITTTPSINHVYTSFGNFLPKVILSDPSGCLILLQGIDTFYFTGAKADFGIDSLVFCDRGLVNFSDSTTSNDPIVSYNWNFGDGTTSTLQNPSHLYSSPGLYSVQLAVQTQIGCTDTLRINNLIRVVQRPLIDIGGDSIVCVNLSLLHSGIFLQPDTSIVSWQWNFPNGNSSLIQNPPSQQYTTPGTFSITTIATNSTGCMDTSMQTVYVNPLPVVSMPSQITIQNGFPVTIPATYSPNTISWVWSPATGLSCTSCPTPEAGPKFNTFYQVYFVGDNGCTNIGSIQANVTCANSNLFIPNTFSPNRDGSNDIFYPRGKGLDRVIMLRIFNRWGEVVFEKRDFQVNDASSGWDGTYKGNKPKADVYVYQAEVFCDNGDVIKLNGNIALIL